MASAFLVLISLVMVTGSLTQRLEADRVIETARALQAARSGVEVALAELNTPGGATWPAPWITNGPTHQCTSMGFDVTVTDGGETTVDSIGTNGPIRWRMRVSVGGGGGAGAQSDIFQNLIYTRDSNIYIRGQGGSVTLDGYDSNQGVYDQNNPLLPNELVIMSDQTPFRPTDWNTTPTNDWMTSVIMSGTNVTVKAKVVVRSRDLVGEPIPGGQEEKGYAIFDNNDSLMCTGANCTVDFQGTVFKDTTRTVARYPDTTYPAELGPEVDPAVLDPQLATGLNPLYYDPETTFLVCPGETLKATEVTLQNAALLLGCSTDPASPDYCGLANTFLDPRDEYWGLYRTCPGANPSQPVTLSMGTGPGSGYQGDYALSIGAGGQIRVYSPTKMYYNYAGLSGGGLNIGGDGIVNNVKNGAGVTDPSKLTIYGGGHRFSDSSYLYTNQAFHGTIFNPYASVEFNGPSNEPANVQFFGALNVRQVRIVAQTGVGFHWDRALYGGSSSVCGNGICESGETSTSCPSDCHGLSSTFRPRSDSWQIEPVQ